MEISKALSEKCFIDVIYSYLLGDKMSMDEKEHLARFALALHKEYWHLCKSAIMEQESTTRP